MATAVLALFTAALFVAAWIVAGAARQVRAESAERGRVVRQLEEANQRLRALSTMVTKVGAERRFDVVLAGITAELSAVAGVPAIAVKLLDEERRELRYVAAHGLPEDWLGKTVHVDRSPLNSRCIEGETLACGSVDGREHLELRQELVNLGFHSAVLAPLRLVDRVIGTLSFYSPSPHGFSGEDATFLKLVGELVAIAIDNARAYEAIERILHEQAQSMLEVAHNLRAPLGAGLSMLELLTDGYLGELSHEQKAHLSRLAERLGVLDQTIGELLTIARSRDRSHEIRDVDIDLAELARQTEATFKEEAAGKGVSLEVESDAGLPTIPSGGDLLQQILHNLVSNAIKYTPGGGAVFVRVSPRGAEGARIMVRDTGIGIPAEEQEKLFREFFRASNAKRVTTQGTGLGLALVKRAVERHRGQVRMASQVGEGTTVVVDLPGGHPDTGRPDLP
jgi:signal transduction histidine kinase